MRDLLILIKWFAFQCQFWALWSNSRVKQNDFKWASEAADDLFEQGVHYWQGRTGKRINFTRVQFQPTEFKMAAFVKLEEQINEITTKDADRYKVEFENLVQTLRGYVG